MADESIHARTATDLLNLILPGGQTVRTDETGRIIGMEYQGELTSGPLFLEMADGRLMQIYFGEPREDNS